MEKLPSMDEIESDGSLFSPVPEVEPCKPDRGSTTSTQSLSTWCRQGMTLPPRAVLLHHLPHLAEVCAEGSEASLDADSVCSQSDPVGTVSQEESEALCLRPDRSRTGSSDAASKPDGVISLHILRQRVQAITAAPVLSFPRYPRRRFLKTGQLGVRLDDSELQPHSRNVDPMRTSEQA